MVTNNSINSADPVNVAKGGTGAATLTGVLTGNGTSAVTANAITQYGVVIGGASNAVGSTAVGTAAQVLTSNGAGMDPTFQAVPAGGDVTAGSNITANSVVIGDDGAKGVKLSTMFVSDAGEMTNASQPAFLAYLASSDTNASGNGTSYLFGDTDVNTTFTEVFDQNADFVAGSSSGCVFTAPVTGRYFLEMEATFSSSTGTTQIEIDIITSNRNYRYLNTMASSSATNAAVFSVLADMDASDTVTWTSAITGVGADTATALGTANLRNKVSGFLAC